MMKKVLIASLWAATMMPLIAAEKNKNNVAKVDTTLNFNWTKSIKQGFDMTCWISTEMTCGEYASPNFRLIGCDYPNNAGNEHLFGGGPVVGGIWNGLQRRVDFGYLEG